MKNLFKSLAAFQQECPIIFKGTTAGQGNFAYQYADLPAIFTVINPLMKKHGLGFSQVTECVDGVDYLITILFHIESGETMESKLRLMPNVELRGQNIFQSYGSQLTYFRRYGISQILGLVTDKDTDASGEQTKPQAPAKPKAKKTFQDGGYESAIEAVLAGKVTVAKIEASYELTDVERKQLNEAEQIFKSNQK